VSSRQEEIEELIIQGLGHQERRNILKIISLAEGGASYSVILGELGLNTGRMNYHLRQLEGLVVRNGDRKYHLTPLGEKGPKRAPLDDSEPRERVRKVPQ